MENYYQPKKAFRLPFKLPSFNFKFKVPASLFGLLLKIFLIFLGVVIVVGGIFAFIYGRPAYVIYQAALNLKDNSYGLQQSLKTQDLNKIEQNLTAFKEDYESFKTVYAKNSPKLKSLPVIKNYVSDVDHLMKASDTGIELGFLIINTIEPYAEDLGLKAGSRLTNEQKIQKLATVMPKISNEVDMISKLMLEIDSELVQIDATKYPEEFRGAKVREQIVSIKTVFSELAEKSPKFKGLFEQLPALIGVDRPKRYLVLMANSTEIRMNGGFNTYIVAVEISNGIPKIVASIDTYDIDKDNYALVNTNVPDYLRNYLRVTRLYARDAISTSPDFKEASDLFVTRYWNVYRKVYPGRLPEIDGLIQVNTHLAEDLLEVLGPVEVEGRSFLTDEGTYKGFNDTEFNSNNVIYNLEVIANANLSQIKGRKEIINFLLENILNKVLNARSENLIPLAQTFLEALGSKDIVVYSFDPAVGRAMEDLGYAGRVVATPNPSWDYLFVVHSNFGAGKRDWIVKRETTKETLKKDGKNYSKVSIKVENPKAPEWWEPDWQYTYRDYLRVYVPKGSKLIKAQINDGQNINTKELEAAAFNKDYFEFFFTVPEGKIATLDIEYNLPDTVNLADYKLLLQKQSGTHGDIYSVIYNGAEKKFSLNSDMEIIF